jgi:hypothetical protein
LPDPAEAVTTRKSGKRICDIGGRAEDMRRSTNFEMLNTKQIQRSKAAKRQRAQEFPSPLCALASTNYRSSLLTRANSNLLSTCRYLLTVL